MTETLLPLRFSEEAADELEAAAHWYEEQRRGLGSEFIRTVEARLDSIQRTPQLYPCIYRENVRRALLKRFPYGLIFRDLSNRIEIISVFHLRRDPAKLTKRL